MRYAGTAADGSYHSSAWSGKTAERSSASAAANLLPLQTDIRQLMSPEISELADSSPPDGGGLEDDPSDSSDVRDGTCHDSGGSWQGAAVASYRESRGAPSGTGTTAEESTEERGRSRTQSYVGGLLPGLGECDVVLVLDDDGSRLPVHSCLLAAFSGAFRDLFLCRNGLSCRRLRCRPCGEGGDRYSSGELVERSTGTSDASCDAGVGVDDQRKRSRDVHPLLAGRGLTGEKIDAERRARRASGSTSEAAVAAAALAATSVAENTGWQSPAGVEWRVARGEVLVRFWGAGTVAAIVRHVYTGQTPAGVHTDGLGRLLAASVALRMPRLMRQVEHLLAASLSSKKGNDRSAQLKQVARLLRAVRVLRATDLEHRCTLYLQANGGFPAVMKVNFGCGLIGDRRTMIGDQKLSRGPECAIVWLAAASSCLVFLFVRPAQNSKNNKCPVACRANVAATPGATRSFSQRVGRYAGFGPLGWQRLPWIRSSACVVIVGGGFGCSWFRFCGGGGGEACGGLVPSQARGGFRPARSSPARPA